MNCIHAKLYYKYDVYIASCVRQTSENDIDKCEDITLIPDNISKFLGEKKILSHVIRILWVESGKTV